MTCKKFIIKKKEGEEKKKLVYILQTLGARSCSVLIYIDDTERPLSLPPSSINRCPHCRMEKEANEQTIQ